MNDKSGSEADDVQKSGHCHGAHGPACDSVSKQTRDRACAVFDGWKRSGAGEFFGKLVSPGADMFRVAPVAALGLGHRASGETFGIAFKTAPQGDVTLGAHAFGQNRNLSSGGDVFTVR